MSLRHKLLVLGAYCVAAPASAISMSGAVGITGEEDMTWRVSVVSDWDKRWWDSDRGYLTGYWDAGYTYWESSEESTGAHSLSLSPVLVYQFHGQRWQPFVEFGIGVSIFSKADVSERDLGSSFNFEDRVGVGIVLPSGSRLGLRVMHYSNANIKQPNEGVDSVSLFYTRSF